jgi:thymidylate synthase (FAD)
MDAQLLSYTQHPEKLIATAAKVCYAPGTVDKVWHSTFAYEEFIEKLRSIGHMSPFEHANFTFGIDGISRACSHQLVRHRIASFSQQSQRYVKYDTDLKDMGELFVVPDPIMDSDDETFDTYYNALESIADIYEELVQKLMESGMDEKKAAENARYILPNAMKTNLVMTMNARELMHFFELRCCRRAQEEINTLAWSMKRLLEYKFPAIFKNTGPNCITGKCKEGKMSCGRPYQTELPGV